MWLCRTAQPRPGNVGAKRGKRYGANSAWEIKAETALRAHGALAIFHDDANWLAGFVALKRICDGNAKRDVARQIRAALQFTELGNPAVRRRWLH